MPFKSKEVKYVSQYNKDYYNKNKDEIMKKAAIIIKCECGRDVRNGHLKRHLKTALHDRNVKKLNQS